MPHGTQPRLESIQYTYEGAERLHPAGPPRLVAVPEREILRNIHTEIAGAINLSKLRRGQQSSLHHADVTFMGENDVVQKRNAQDIPRRFQAIRYFPVFG